MPRKNSFKSELREFFRPLLNERGEIKVDPKDTPPPPTKIAVEIDGETKEFDADGIKNLLSQQASATQKTQEVSAVLEAVNRYGSNVDDFLANAEGSFALMSELMDKGIIDDKGNIVEKKAPEPPAGIPPATPPKPPAKADEVALKALVDPVVSELKEALTKSNENVTLLMKLRLQDKVQAKFPDLSEDDIARVFATAERDRNKTLMEHAKTYSESSAEKRKQIEDETLKKYGLNREELDRRHAIEQDPKGGAASLFGQEVKFSFKRGKGNVDPAKASREFLEHALYNKG